MFRSKTANKGIGVAKGESIKKEVVLRLRLANVRSKNLIL
jgi:hypothetical protein